MRTIAVVRGDVAYIEKFKKEHASMLVGCKHSIYHCGGHFKVVFYR